MNRISKLATASKKLQSDLVLSKLVQQCIVEFFSCVRRVAAATASGGGGGDMARALSASALLYHVWMLISSHPSSN
jgi:hypothetical protein